MRRILLALALLSMPCLAQQPVQALGSASVNASDAAWTSATSLNTAATLISNTSSYNSVLVTLVQGTTITGGVVTFEQSIDNSTYTTVQGVQLGTTVIAGPTYTLVASTNVSFLFPVNAPYFRVRLSTAITGTGTVTVQHASQTFPLAALIAGTETLAAGTAYIGNVGQNGTWNVGVTGTVSVVGNAGATVDAAPAATPPTNALYTANRDSTGVAVPVVCDKSAFITPSTAVTTQIVALVSAKTIYVCSYSVSFLGSATQNTGIFKYGTGTACATGTTSLSSTLQGPNAVGPGTVITRGAGIGYLMKTASANALCFTTSGAVAVGVDVSYAQF